MSAEWGSWALWMVALVACGVAWLWRRAEGQKAELVQERDRLMGRCRELETTADRMEKARQRQAEELATFRRKAEKTRKRESRTSPPPLGTAARIQDLETALARSERACQHAQAERDRLAGEAAELRRKREARSDARPVASAPAPSDSDPGPPKDALEASAAPEVRAELETGITAARARIAELEAALGSTRLAEARLKKRVANQEQLYAAIRAELEAKKDRLRTQEEQIERLRALQVALMD